MILLHEWAMNYFSHRCGRGGLSNWCKLLYLLEVDGTTAACLNLGCVPLTVFLPLFSWKLLLHCYVWINSESLLILISYSNELALKGYRIICNSMSSLSPALVISSFPKLVLLKIGAICLDSSLFTSMFLRVAHQLLFLYPITLVMLIIDLCHISAFALGWRNR